MTYFSLFTVVAVGGGLRLALGGWPAGRRRAAILAAVMVAAHPGAGLCLGLSGLAWRWARSRKRSREAAAEAGREVELLARSLLVALSGGLSPDAALRTARRSLRSRLGGEVDRILRESARTGLASALLAAGGAGGRLFRQLGAAHLSGAPMLVTLTALARDLHDSARAEAVQRARKLPVKMVIPLSLLMLPGFLMLMAGPAVLPSFGRLLGPMVGS